MARSNSELVNSSETDLAEEPNHDVIVVGAGLSGLACALTLHGAGVNVAVVEASDGVGGRVRTDIVDGFQLDRGFQIFLTAYPEARSMLDYDRLNLRPFYAGAMVRFGGSWHRVADPFRHPWDGVLSLLNPVGTVGDKIKVGLLRLGLMARDPDDLLEAAETSTLERLKAEGFSDSMIKRFFRPFLGGIFFDNNLRTTSRLFEFVMRMLSTGANTLPANGIGAIAQNLTDQLPPGCVKTGVEVTRCAGASNGTLPSIQVATGESLTAGSGIVIAAEEPSARKILGSILEAMPSKPGPGVGTCCLYFRADSAPSSAENILYLNGEGEGLVNNCCFPSTVAKEYAPPGETLVSVSVIGTHEELNDQQLEDRVLEELSSWFGSACVSMWRHIKTYRIPFCQPNQTPPTDLKRPVKLGNGLYVSGDHRDSATFDGALKSGRRAAEAVLESM